MVSSAQAKFLINCFRGKANWPGAPSSWENFWTYNQVPSQHWCNAIWLHAGSRNSWRNLHPPSTTWEALSKKEKPLLCFCRHEKAFDRVPRSVLWWAMRKLGVEEWIVRTVMAMYANAKSAVRVNGSYSPEFDVKVSVHQGLVPRVNILAESPPPPPRGGGFNSGVPQKTRGKLGCCSPHFLVRSAKML